MEMAGDLSLAVIKDPSLIGRIVTRERERFFIQRTIQKSIGNVEIIIIALQAEIPTR